MAEETKPDACAGSNTEKLDACEKEKSDDCDTAKVEAVEKETAEETGAEDVNGSEKKTDESETGKVEKSAEPEADNNNWGDWHLEGDTYVYTDSATGTKYYYDNDKKEWLPKVQETKSDIKKPETEKEGDGSGSGYESEDDDGNVKRSRSDPRYKHPALESTYDPETGVHTYTDPTDGTKFEWDAEKNAWFPKVDEDFLAAYQMNYGFVDNVTKEEEKPVESVKEMDTGQMKKKGEKRKPAWFEMEDDRNTKVYVENLPSDVTEEEFVETMSKCGVIVKDPDTNKCKVKLYKDENGQIKGDALCSYIRIESVDLALQILDGYELRGKKLKVQRAKFSLKGAYDPSKKPRKKNKKEMEKIMKKQEKLFAWVPEKLRGQRSKHEKVVILKNLFDREEIKKSPELLLELQQQLRDEVSRCGKVKKVVVHESHEDGVAQIFFSEAEEADLCIQMLHKRMYRSRRLLAEAWDGTTSYKSNETEEERAERMKNWANFLED